MLLGINSSESFWSYLSKNECMTELLTPTEERLREDLTCFCWVSDQQTNKPTSSLLFLVHWQERRWRAPCPLALAACTKCTLPLTALRTPMCDDMTFAAVLGPFYCTAVLWQQKQQQSRGGLEGAQSCAHPCLHLLHRDQDTQRSKAHHTTTRPHHSQSTEPTTEPTNNLRWPTHHKRGCIECQESN